MEGTGKWVALVFILTFLILGFVEEYKKDKEEAELEIIYFFTTLLFLGLLFFIYNYW